MTLERKSSFQLLFQKDDRLDDTVHAMKTLLKQAGKDDALLELENYLSSQGGKQNRIESSKMFEILNRHMPPMEKGSSMESLYKLAKIETVKELGSGSFGRAYLVSIDGKPSVLKELGEPQSLTLERSTRPNEAMGSYLTSKNHPRYLENKVNIAQPTSYMISVKKEGKREYQMVDPHTMRSLVKEAKRTGSGVRCHGIVMPKAEGKEMLELVHEGTLTKQEKKQFVQGTLQSIKGLNERGFVHRDIKPENSFFDRESGISTLIDTGLLFKSSKNQEKHPNSESMHGKGIGTTIYLHPRAIGGGDHGTEQDLYALGIMTLEVDHPEAFYSLFEKIHDRNVYTEDGVTKEWLTKTLNDEIRYTKPGEWRDALLALRNDINDPNTLSGFAMRCFEMAGQPAEKWKDREWAQEQYSNLLEHPGVK